METPKLFMILLGCTPANRNTEQHDVFFSIGKNLKELVPQIIAFWPEANNKIHLDAWREVTRVGAYNIVVEERKEGTEAATGAPAKLFFINLGGYKRDEFEEYHYKMLVASSNKGEAIKESMQTSFYRHIGFTGASSHVDDKFGIDIDELYEIEDILLPEIKMKYFITLTPADLQKEDEIHLGYRMLQKL